MSGEKPGAREAMGRVQQRLVESGSPPKDAQRLARESLLRVTDKDSARKRN
jgi:hypothetical protein